MSFHILAISKLNVELHCANRLRGLQGDFMQKGVSLAMVILVLIHGLVVLEENIKVKLLVLLRHLHLDII
jgi:hypothetical protein